MARIDTLPGVDVFPTVPETLFAVAAVVEPDSPYVEYVGAFAGGMVTVNLVVLLLAGRADSTTWQNRLDSMLSAGADADPAWSVFDAIEGDRTLGLANHTAKTGSAYGWGNTLVNDVEYGSCRLGVAVTTNRQ